MSQQSRACRPVRRRLSRQSACSFEIRAAAGQQPGGRAVLDDAAALHHQHPVGDRHRRQPVRDDHRRPPGQDRRSACCTRRSLGMSQRRRGLVQDQHRRLGQERPGERDQLPLPGRQPAAALADVGVVAVGQRRMNGSAPIACAAASISARLAPGRPSAMLSATDPVNRKFSWVTMTMLATQRRSGMALRSTPSSRTWPWPRSRTGPAAWPWSILPAPVAPTRATVCPAGMCSRGRAAPARPGSRTDVVEVDGRRARPRQRRPGAPARGRRLLLQHARRSSPARPPPTGTSCRTATGPAAGRRTAAGRAGRRPATPTSMSPSITRSPPKSSTTRRWTLPTRMSAGRVHREQARRRRLARGVPVV